MTTQEHADKIIHQYRMLLMDDGEDFGEEILVSILSEKMALIDVQNTIDALNDEWGSGTKEAYFEKVKEIIQKK